MHPGPTAVAVSELVQYAWMTCEKCGTCRRDIAHLMVWHYCTQPVDSHIPLVAEQYPDGVMGWRPTGVGHHTLVQENPLTITASVFWPQCCGLHGFITDGKWVAA